MYAIHDNHGSDKYEVCYMYFRQAEELAKQRGVQVESLSVKSYYTSYNVTLPIT